MILSNVDANPVAARTINALKMSTRKVEATDNGACLVSELDDANATLVEVDHALLYPFDQIEMHVPRHRAAAVTTAHKPDGAIKNEALSCDDERDGDIGASYLKRAGCAVLS